MSGAKKQKILALSPSASSKIPDASSAVDHWPRLSDEIVLIILRLLPEKDLVKSSLINKRFRDLSRDKTLWTELTLDYVNFKQNAESCRKLVERCEKLSSLKISNKTCQWDKLNIMMTVVTRAKESLRCLEIDNALKEWSPAAMAKLGSLQNLRSLTFSFSSVIALAVNSYKGAKVLEELANLGQLEVLKLSITSNSLPVMKRVFQQLKKLKEVDIYTTDYDDSLVVALAQNNTSLKSLRLRNYPYLSDETVDVLANSCPALEELAISFSRCNGAGDDAIDKLSSSFPRIKSLIIGGSTVPIDTTDQKLTKYVEAFRSLESLDLVGYTYHHYHVTDSGIERMVSSADNLKHLTIRGAPRVTEDLVERLRKEYPSLDLRIYH